LSKKADLLADLGVKTVTITINAVNPQTVTQIYTHIRGKINVEIARSFTRQQFDGITACTTRGIHVKINSIVIPSINAGELEEVARISRERGAHIQNITPLIPLGDFSTLDPPPHSKIVKIRKQCAEYLPQFTCCKQCRADATGIPGRGDCF
jgi:nitrogen fixation protein NifB